METRQLRMFMTVAELLSFSRAADKLYISQSSLSYQITLLENELGVKLFVRNPRNVYLTPEGHLLLDYAAPLLQSVDEFYDALQNNTFSRENKRQSLKLALDRTEVRFEAFGIIDALSDFVVNHPNIAISMASYSADECLNLLEEKGLDVAFMILRHNEKLPALLKYHRLRSDQIVLVCKHDPELKTYADVLRKHPLLMCDNQPRGQSRLLRSLQCAGIEPKRKSVSSIAHSLILAQAGLGCIPIARSYFDTYPHHGLDFIPAPGDDNRIYYAAVWNKANTNPAMDSFFELIQTMGGGKNSVRLPAAQEP